MVIREQERNRLGPLERRDKKKKESERKSCGKARKSRGGRRTKALTGGRAHSGYHLLTRRVDRQESLLESWFSPSARRWPIEHSVALRSPSTSNLDRFLLSLLSFAFKEIAYRTIGDRSSSVPTIDSRARERGGHRSIPIEPRHDLGPLSGSGGEKKKEKKTNGSGRPETVQRLNDREPNRPVTGPV